MLPDFPEIKSRITQRRLRELRRNIDSKMPIASKLKSVVAHEGDGFSLQRTDGKIESQKYQRVSEKMVVSNRLDFDETVGALNDQLEMAADQMAKHIERTLIEAVRRATDEVGNVIDGKGKPFTAETYLQLLEKVDLDFDYFGVPSLPTLTLPPGSPDAIQKELDRLQTSSVLRERLAEIFGQKRKEWLDRESRRRLVD